MFIDEKVINLGSAFTHNPEVVGSSPAYATIKTPDFITKSGVFLTFSAEMKYKDILLTPILTPTRISDVIGAYGVAIENTHFIHTLSLVIRQSMGIKVKCCGSLGVT